MFNIFDDEYEGISLSDWWEMKSESGKWKIIISFIVSLVVTWWMIENGKEFREFLGNLFVFGFVYFVIILLLDAFRKLYSERKRGNSRNPTNGALNTKKGIHKFNDNSSNSR